MTRARRLATVGAALILTLTAAAAAQPTITGINNSQQPRSGRVAIEGGGFGASGEVFIAGLAAWTTTWTETRIVAYVPESAALGPAPLWVVVAGQQSNTVTLTVTERQADGRVRWTFEADGQNLRWRPALAPDGTIYLHGNNQTDGILYALSPDGGLIWVQKVVWYPYVPPSAGPDGALYVGSIHHIYRISPQGAIDWTFTDPVAQGIQVAPTIGPDGKLYAAFDGGLGAVAIEPATGQLVWSDIGDPPMNAWGTPGTEMAFGPSQAGGPSDQLYFHMDGVGTSSIYAFDLDGSQRFAVGLAATRSHEPAVGSDGTLYSPRYTGLWVAAFDSENGVTLWEYDPGWAFGSDDVEIGPDATLYFVGSLGELEAFDPSAQAQIWRNSTGMVLGRPEVTPDGSVIVLHGVPTYGQPGFVKGFAAATGEELWRVDLPGDPFPAFRVLGTDHPRFSADGATAYVSTYTVADGSPFADPRTYLYAIDTGIATIFSDGFESGDTSAWAGSLP